MGQRSNQNCHRHRLRLLTPNDALAYTVGNGHGTANIHFGHSGTLNNPSCFVPLVIAEQDLGQPWLHSKDQKVDVGLLVAIIEIKSLPQMFGDCISYCSRQVSVSVHTSNFRGILINVWSCSWSFQSPPDCCCFCLCLYLRLSFGFHLRRSLGFRN